MKPATFKFDIDNVVLKIADIQMVKELNEDMITSKIMDLTVVYYYTLFHNEKLAVTVPFPKEALEVLETSRQDLYKIALSNTLRINPPVIMSFEDFKKSCPSYAMLEKTEEYIEASKDIYFVANDYGTGAVYILDRNTLDLIADKLQDDLAIIPSSSQEILVLAKSQRRLREWVIAVKEAHELIFDRDERLSNSVYFYNHDTKEFSYQSADDFVCDE